MERDERGWRPNVGAILRRGDNLYLMAERLTPRDTWQFPQGGVDAGETHEEALWRELHEELGLRDPRALCEVVARGPAVRYDFPEGYDAPIARRWKGQEQTLFLLDYRGGDEDFDLELWHTPEFRAVGWFTREEMCQRLWEFKRGVLEATLEALAEHF